VSEDARGAPLPVHLTPAERKELEAWAKNRGHTLEDCAKAALLASARVDRGTVRPWLDVVSIVRNTSRMWDASRGSRHVYIATLRRGTNESRLIISHELARVLEADGLVIVEGGGG